MSKKNLFLLLSCTICIQSSFAMEPPENDQYKQILVLYKSAQNVGNANTAADLLEDAIELKKNTAQNKNNDDDEFYNNCLEIAALYKSLGNIEKHDFWLQKAGQFQPKGLTERGVDGLAWLWNQAINGATAIYENQDKILNAVDAGRRIVNVLSPEKPAPTIPNNPVPIFIGMNPIGMNPLQPNRGGALNILATSPIKPSDIQFKK